MKDQSLIDAVLQGDKNAYSHLVNKYMRRAYFVALGMTGSHETALDLSQDAFVRAYRALSRFERGRNFFTWYYQILRNLCLNEIRRRNHAPVPFSALSGVEALAEDRADAGAAREVEREEEKQHVWDAIARLSEKEREIIVLKEFEGLTYKQISELLGCPIGTVMSRLYTARQNLRSKLEVMFR